MEKNLYIDASHPNETRIVLKSENSIEEYEYEDKKNLNFKNNIYLATISRVEPSLQAAFVNYGRERHGFLAFNDIQSDYYQLPSEDKEKIRIAPYLQDDYILCQEKYFLIQVFACSISDSESL